VLNTCWTEIFFSFIFDGNNNREISRRAYQLYVFVAEESLKKRWRSLRNAFLREEIAHIVDGQDYREEPETRKTYKYYENLLFLKPFIRCSTDSESIPSSKRAKRKVALLEEGEEDPDRMFM